MKIPLSWLKEYAAIDGKNTQDIAHALTQAGLEVEEIAGGDIFSIKVPSNRGDCLSVRGIARELSAIYEIPLKEKSFPLSDSAVRIEEKVSVTVQSPELCPRYSARLVMNVKIAPSPAWLQEKLKACGLNPINNVVDITNLVCLEFGQPMHAFDYKTLEGRKIIVRTARKDERFVTLDENEKTLNEDTLVIADEKKAVAMAGVMGGLRTGVTEKTQHILLESANFNPACIRKASKQYALRTESSYRFERGVDPQGTVAALDYACWLLRQTGTGEIAQGVLDVCEPSVHESRTVTLHEKRCNKILGTCFSAKELSHLLTRLHFKTQEKTNGVHVTVSPHRQDIRLEEDLVEEVARLYGYNNIQETLPRAPVSALKKNEDMEFLDLVRNTCLLLGLQEVRTHSLISPHIIEKCFMKADALIPVRSPVSEDASLLRNTLLPSLLDVAERCAAHQEENLHLFEMARVYEKTKDGKFHEEMQLSGLLTGTSFYQSWNHKENAADHFYFIKGTLELLFAQTGIKNMRIKQSPMVLFHTYNSGEIYSGNVRLGSMGQVHPDVAENFNLSKDVFCFELSAQAMKQCSRQKKTFTHLPRFPWVKRDIAFFIDRNVPHSHIENVLHKSAGSLLENVFLFDVYEGKPVPDGKKNLAYSLTFRHTERTLKSEEADALVASVKEALKKEGAIIRE